MLQILRNLIDSEENIVEIARLFVQMVGVKISRSTLKKEIEEHPDYPGLLSLNDVLSSYGIETLVARFDQDKFTNIPVPFITQIKDENNERLLLTIVKKADNTVVFYHPEKHQWDEIPMDAFFRRGSGIVLLTDFEESAGEKDYKQKTAQEKRSRIMQYFIALVIPMLIIFESIFAFIQSGTNAIPSFIFSVVTFVGGLIGVLLLLYELDQHNPVLQQICSSGKKVNCGAILQSKAAKIFGISWSTIGFCYFSGGILLLLFSGINNPNVLFILSWLNIAAIPYVFYSIYYQWRVAKQWCMLCLFTQCIISLQFLIALLAKWHSVIVLQEISIQLLVQFIIAFAIPFLTVMMIIPAMRMAKQGKRTAIDLQRLKHNPQIFEALLQKQKKVTESTEGLGIFLGNPNANYSVIKVCNPYCGPCAQAHSPIESLIDNNTNVNLQIIFSVTSDDADLRNLPVKHLMAIDERGDEAQIKRALDDWYLAEVKNYDTFAAKYPMNGELQKQRPKLDAMLKWCHQTEIEFTPTFFISLPSDDNSTRNYYQLPEMYSVNDLKYFVST